MIVHIRNFDVVTILYLDLQKLNLEFLQKKMSKFSQNRNFEIAISH